LSPLESKRKHSLAFVRRVESQYKCKTRLRNVSPLILTFVRSIKSFISCASDPPGTASASGANNTSRPPTLQPGQAYSSIKTSQEFWWLSLFILFSIPHPRHIHILSRVQFCGSNSQISTTDIMAHFFLHIGWFGRNEAPNCPAGLKGNPGVETRKTPSADYLDIRECIHDSIQRGAYVDFRQLRTLVGLPLETKGRPTRIENIL
jgi:hypothetical protein